MTLDEAIAALLDRYRAAARNAEDAGDDAEAERCTRRRNWLAGLIGFRTRQETRRPDVYRAECGGHRY